VGGACTPSADNVGAAVVVPKPIEVVAGKDVVQGTYQFQNDAARDVSVIKAGRDLDQMVVKAMGGGSLLLQAGRDVKLAQPPTSGTSNPSNTDPKGGLVYGIGDQVDVASTASNAKPPAVNQTLSDQKGTDIYILAGAANGVAWDAFADAYLDPANSQQVVRTYLPELATYMAGIDAAKYGAMSPAQLVAAFQGLRLAQREVFLDQVYFSELKQTDVDYNTSSSPRYHSYDRGFRATSLLFPFDLSTVQRGDVILSAKPVETQLGGDISILAPFGRVDVGAPIVPDPSGGSGGVITRRGGEIRIMADEDISLFTSRVFTLGGGDITMWSTNGNINAGAGAKTSVVQPQLQYTTDDQGVTSVQSFGLQTGAGIGVLDAQQGNGGERGTAYLVAPRGEVNAGDAGIRVLGNIFIAAQVVVGVENISVSGSSAGVPKVELPSLGALTSASQVATQATAGTEAARAAAAEVNKKIAEDLPSIITVEAVGYETTKGSDTPEPSDDAGRRAPRRAPERHAD